jgi:DNA-directed RNA polymerase subunit M/transcription elongation factor TFIIS
MSAIATLQTDSDATWKAKIDPSRPTYECPRCKSLAMQFHAVDGQGDEQRTDSFICRACGSSWQA